MSIEEKILGYLYKIFPDFRVFNTDVIPLEDLGLDPENDLLEYQKEFDRLMEENFVKYHQLMLSITFRGISYYEKKYLHPNYYYLKAIKIFLEFLERLENGEYLEYFIPKKEVLAELKKEGIELDNKELYQFLTELMLNTDFFQHIGPSGIHRQDRIQPYFTNRPLLTPKGRKYLKSWRIKNELFTKVTDNTQKEIILEEFVLLQKLIEQGAWKDACVKMGSMLEYLLNTWFIKKGITPSRITSIETVKKWKEVTFSKMIDFYMNNAKKFENEIGTSTDWKLVKNVLKDYRNYVHLQNYEERVRKGDVLRKKEFDRIYPIFQDMIRSF